MCNKSTISCDAYSFIFVVLRVLWLVLPVILIQFMVKDSFNTNLIYTIFAFNSLIVIDAFYFLFKKQQIERKW